jgi:SGT1 protein
MYWHAVDAQAADGLRLHALDFVAQQAHGRIWQQQRLVLHNGCKERAPWWGRQQPADRQCLWGATAFGDNVEDEWFIVWLLLELTEVHPGMIAR